MTPADVGPPRTHKALEFHRTAVLGRSTYGKDWTAGAGARSDLLAIPFTAVDYMAWLQAGMAWLQPELSLNVGTGSYSITMIDGGSPDESGTVAGSAGGPS